MATPQEPPPRKAPPCDITAAANATNIDRRTCQRVVPMKVLGLGLSRTGTASMRQALIDLGYSECYHYSSVLLENSRDAEMWNEAIDAKFNGKGKPFGREEWDMLLGHCMAVTDTPCAAFYKELLEAYPDAKVVLTVRDTPEQWWQSQMHTIMPFFDLLALPAKTWKHWLWKKFLPEPTALDKLNVTLAYTYPMYTTLVKDLREGTKEGITWYENYVKEIKRIVSEERLLVMNVKEGWAPLCKFLGKEAPGWEFPRVNSSAQWDENIVVLYQMMDGIVWANAMKTAKRVGSVVVGLGAVAAAYAMRSRWWKA